MLGIYIHIPFCLSKCPYCDFYSLPYREELAQQYVRTAVRAVETAPAAGQVVDSVYFGGGTPVLLGERLLEILSAVRRHFAVQPESEITLEANPAAMTFAQLQALREGGFNRISMGVQSASDRELQTLGRRHSFAQAQESVRMAQAAGFRNVSVDLMLGTPGQTAQAIDRFVETFDALGVQHISGYLLKIEPGTLFARQHIERDCPDEERSAELYLHTVEQMARHGFLQYEVSNFARPGFESRHNLKYWRCEQYLGLGPAAHSFWEGRRFYFPRDLAGFLAGGAPVDDGPGGAFPEYAMLALRLTEGLRRKACIKRFADGDAQYEAVRRAAAWLPKSLVLADHERIALTAEGFLVSNTILSEILP